MEDKINLEAQLKQKLIEINSILIKEEDIEDIGVLSGISGLALYHFYYSKYNECDESYDIAVSIIEQCIYKINEGYSYPTYCSGIAGFGWFIDHVIKEEFIKDLPESILVSFDEYIYNAMISCLDENNYDFLHGAVGYGYYFFERYVTTKDKKNKRKYIENIKELVAILYKIATKEENQIMWVSLTYSKNNNKTYDLSLSHGISSLITFFSKIYLYDVFKDCTDKILRGSILFLISKETHDTTSISLYPSLVSENGNEKMNSRLSWCYGDLGIGLCLFKASKALNDLELEKKAMQILMHCSGRKSLESNFVIDASICHGAFGIAKIFHRIYKETGHDKFKLATDYWLSEGLKMARHDKGLAGFMQYEPNELKENDWKNYTNVLVGISGIGLVIIDYLADFETNWDQCLMIS